MTSGLQLHFIRGEHAHVPIFSSVVPVSARLPHYSAGKVRHPLWAGNTASAWIAADCASPRRVDGRTCAQLPADKSGINRDYTAGGWGFHRPPTRAHTHTHIRGGWGSITTHKRPPLLRTNTPPRHDHQQLQAERRGGRQEAPFPAALPQIPGQRVRSQSPRKNTQRSLIKTQRPLPADNGQPRSGSRFCP